MAGLSNHDSGGLLNPSGRGGQGVKTCQAGLL